MTSLSEQTERIGSSVIYWSTSSLFLVRCTGTSLKMWRTRSSTTSQLFATRGWFHEQRRQILYFSLEGTALRWFGNHEAFLTSWKLYNEYLLRDFANRRLSQRAEDILKPRIEGPNESVVGFVEDILCVSTRAGPQSTEETKGRALMRGVKSYIFGGLFRNRPTTVVAFVAETTNIERTLAARSDHYHRVCVAPTTISAFASSRPAMDGHDKNAILEVVREIIQEPLEVVSDSRKADVRFSWRGGP
ncbi:hypothetical protein HPB48_013029 [Haemaphysalis longicornis]|uniref:Retrotransposon gag domain-containing protein n=1 Tax=Haemaphysalis longicornis TaxID=44386 RepID=A0A9J6GGD5_HAELO|nr:hypothetical protein HPB48_013029 [Haemaphysalis longicornis]